ncbi:uncharacterized protein [Nicotiana tomentosiformis]|uniref:uncharacterized protein n=1 Tax=Nicotiana tomentosiformis TaxID=4098 RepID=UPI00388CB37A
MDFVVGLPWTLRKFYAVWVIVDRLTKSSHFIPVVITYSSERLAHIYIREIVRLHGAWDQLLPLAEFAYNNNFQSSIQIAHYEALYGRQCRSLVGWFDPGMARLLGTDLIHDALEKVLLRVSPMKGVMRFGKKGKLSPRYIVPFDMLERVGEMSYKLALPPSLSGVHLVFHVSMFRKHYGDLSHVLECSTMHLDEDLTYDMEPVAILDRQV